MNNIEALSIGEAWLDLVKLVEKEGHPLEDEGKEVLDVRVSFKDIGDNDKILSDYADDEMLESMQSVFFGKGENKLGHSYKDLTRGPLGRNDLTDIVELLKEKGYTKRATLTLCGNGSGKVPCINIVNFLFRDNKIDVYYFSRGQDAYKKFYADAKCISSMQDFVSNELDVSKGVITGYISSAHNYYEDKEMIDGFIGGL